MLDEATASIDRDTDRLIQSMIRESFEGVTTMVIAHRLNTIMDFDRILVFDEGRVVEFDTVSELFFCNFVLLLCPVLRYTTTDLNIFIFSGTCTYFFPKYL